MLVLVGLGGASSAGAIGFLDQWGSGGTGPGKVGFPIAVAVDKVGRVYVADTGNNRIEKFTGSGAFLGQWGIRGSGNGEFDSPEGVAIDSAGNVYAADAGNNRVEKFALDGDFLTQWGSAGSGPGQFHYPVDVGPCGRGRHQAANARSRPRSLWGSDHGNSRSEGHYGFGDGPRHDLAHPGPLRRDLLQRQTRHRDDQRLHQPSHGEDPPRQALPGAGRLMHPKRGGAAAGFGTVAAHRALGHFNRNTGTLSPSLSPFTKILCAVDGSPQSAEAARQAIALAAPGAELRFVTVSRTVRQRFSSAPDPSEEPFQEVLEEAMRLAEEAGISTSSEIFNALYAGDVLLPESRDYDLLVIGSPDQSRAAGIALAGTASRLVHDAEGAVLVARQAPGEDEFPKNVLLASDGAPESWPPAQVASQLAEAFDARVEVVNVADKLPTEQRRALEDQIAAVGEASGEEPELVEAEGRVSRAIVETAEQQGSSLIVTGHRGLRGLRALASVSERVVHAASCSVLLVPDREAG